MSGIIICLTSFGATIVAGLLQIVGIGEVSQLQTQAQVIGFFIGLFTAIFANLIMFLTKSGTQ